MTTAPVITAWPRRITCNNGMATLTATARTLFEESYETPRWFWDTNVLLKQQQRKGNNRHCAAHVGLTTRRLKGR
eukprot:1139524-Pelagomonas_calceolata.AAC.16